MAGESTGSGQQQSRCEETKAVPRGRQATSPGASSTQHGARERERGSTKEGDQWEPVTYSGFQSHCGLWTDELRTGQAEGTLDSKQIFLAYNTRLHQSTEMKVVCNKVRVCEYEAIPENQAVYFTVMFVYIFLQSSVVKWNTNAPSANIYAYKKYSIYNQRATITLN